MIGETDREYFARRLEDERRMAGEARDTAARLLHMRLASEYARRARNGAAYKPVA